ncbi:uncharacterized protein B0T15DRAFT_93696 [Chaetomium strumarium]|uniref:C3H1-type domain-containing protein n=1 Tax=Chaetomium strumarium TaxID=1170767 RepID=A0AAJ0GXN3_9PEZI|nr:hypothetical protein B0T15DRAFT_93696 [Chaetomium strumarium]
MDQSHGEGIGSWDPASYPGEPWDHDFGGSHLAYQGGGEDNAFANPGFLAGGGLNPPPARSDNQVDLFRPFDPYYGQGGAWSDDPLAAAAPFSHDAGLGYGQAFFGDAHHPTDANQTVDTRFALAGYTQAPVAQWAGYEPRPQYENPLAAARPPAVSAPAPHGAPAPFFSGHRYQEEEHQQAPRPVHPQFAASFDGALDQPVAVTGSPRVHAQPPARDTTFPGPPRQEPPQQVPHQVAQRSGVQPAPRAAGAGQQTSDQQPVNQIQAGLHAQQSSAPIAVAGVKRGPASEPQAASAVAKKAKLLPTAAASPRSASVGSPSASTQTQPQTVSGRICSINFQDNDLLSAAEGRPGAMLPGVANLVIGAAPVRLQSRPPTIRNMTLASKGGKPPLFPQLPRGWTPAECLGNHLYAYQHATGDVDFQRADICLEIWMKRGNTEIAPDWWRKGLKDGLGKEPKRLGPPAEPLYTTIKAEEILRVHPAHVDNKHVIQNVCSEYGVFLHSRAQSLLTALKKPNEQSQEDKVDAEAQVRLAKDLLERAIVAGLQAKPVGLLAKLSSQNKLFATLINVLVNLINAGEANSSLVKGILRLYTRLTEVTSEQLMLWKMNKIRNRLEKAGDEEAKGVMATIFEMASWNDDKKAENESDSAGTVSGGGGKKAAPAQTKVLSKQSTPGNDTKKMGPSSTNKSASSTTDLRKNSSLPASSKVTAPNTGADQTAAKVPKKMPAPAAGAKRSREEDAAGAEVRSVKKPATDNSSSSSTKASSAAGKSPAGPSTKAPATKASTSTTASSSTAVPTKPRSGLLLPGKARPAQKPVPKSDPAKVDAQKSSTSKMQATKADASKSVTTKAQSTPTASGAAKSAKPKPAEATKQAPASRSIFSELMQEIDEAKKIKTPETAAKRATLPDPNETPEQRARRLRKESRRGLRVAFKSGDALVEVREFMRHPEEIAESLSMARNAATEGRYKNSEESEMMKRLHSGKGIKAFEINDRDWEELSGIDFAAHIISEQRAKTYDTRGGLRTFETEEQKLTMERESKELMVIYHNSADIPPTPRSPPYEPSLSSAGQESRLPPATPGYDEMMRRTQEWRSWGSRHASHAAQSRADLQSRPDYANYTNTLQSLQSIAESVNGQATRQPEAPAQQPAVQDPRAWYEPAAAARRDQEVVDLLHSDRVRNWQDPDPYNHELARTARRDPDPDPEVEAKVQKALADIAAIVASIPKDPPRPAQPAPPAQPVPVSQPVQQAASAPQASNAQDAQASAPDYSAAWAQYYAAQQQHQLQQHQAAHQAWYGQYQNPYTQAANPYVQAQAPQTAQQQTADPNNQVASILAALGNQQQHAAQPQHPSAADPNAPLQAIIAAITSGNQGQAAAPAPADPQSTQYVMEVVRWATAQNQGQTQAQAGQSAQQTWNSYGQNSQAYGTHGQSYGQANHQEREAYGQTYGLSQDRERDSYGRDRERERERENNNRDRDFHHRGGKGRGGGNKHDKVPDHLRGINRALIGTKTCAFWAKGQCAKGENCTFRHE